MRGRLIDAAKDIICEQGYGALTARTLADRLSLKRQIVHYYFESMDELLIQLVRRSAERTLVELDDPEVRSDPLRAIWRMCNDRDSAVLALELAALAARKPQLRAAVRDAAEAMRAVQAGLLSRYLEEKGLPASIDPEVATIVLSSLAYTLIQEEAVGIVSGHERLRALVEARLEQAGSLENG
jgi:AcrR family transcriptional regulator